MTPVFLPQTSFAMRANLKDKEKELIQFWKDHQVYQNAQHPKAAKNFILHVGPPYANGAIHSGHAFNFILKDVIVKNKRLQGYHAPLVAGWDCHGLPIEVKVEEDFKKKGIQKDTLSKVDFIKACREFASHWVGVQKKGFEDLGILFDNHHYSTMDQKSEASIMKNLSDLLMKGLIYRGQKPVFWSVVEQTALAEAEVEYQNHISDAIFVGFPIISGPFKGAKAIIWTTTPWSLPGNRAIAYHPDITYGLYDTNHGQVIVAKDLFDQIPNLEGTCIKTFSGDHLEGVVCHHPFHGMGYDFDVPLLPGDHVSADTGTGLVHTAPTHGVEDFELGKRYGLEVPVTILGNGTYADHIPLFKGEHVYKVNPKIIDILQGLGLLISHSKLTHSYPHSWRSKKPLIYLCTSQWFLNIDTVRSTALEAIKHVHWIPKSGENRITSMVTNRPDWCLSRQRTWGVPLPIIINQHTKEPLKDQKVQENILRIIQQEGVEAWFTRPVSDFLNNHYDASLYEKVEDIVDVWFDSASTHDFVLNSGDFGLPEGPADLYLEGSDQHRGWFQSSLIHGYATTGYAPYKAVLTHGFLLDEKGQKMSKSLGNVVAPHDYPADLLRLWTVLSDYQEDVRIGKIIMTHVEDVYRRIRNTFRYLLGALNGYTITQRHVSDLHPYEQFICHHIHGISQNHDAMMESYDFLNFYQKLHHFCNATLSAFYFDIRKDSLYCDADTSVDRQGARNTFYLLLLALLKYWSPVLSFTCEEVFQTLKKDVMPDIDVASVFLFDFDKAFLSHPLNKFIKKNDDLAKDFEDLFYIRSLVNTAIEKKRVDKIITSSLQAVIDLKIPNFDQHLLSYDLKSFLMVSDISIAQGDEEICVSISNLQKCPRCWKYEALNDGDQCSRCQSF